MKKLIAVFLIGLSFSNLALADCDWSKIVHNADGTTTYSKELHLCVGHMKQDLEAANLQIVEYKKAIDLKDLALTDSNKRSDIWMASNFKLQDRINSVEELKSKNQIMMFFAGVAVTSLAVWGAGQLARH